MNVWRMMPSQIVGEVPGLAGARAPGSCGLSGTGTGADPRGVVLVVGHVLKPGVLRAAVRARVLPQGEVDHEVVRGGAVPVLLAGGRIDDIAWVRLDDLAAAGLDQGDALDDVKGLAQAVGVPGGAGARGEPDHVRPGAGGLLAPVDDVEPDIAGEHLGRSLAGRRLLQQFHRALFLSGCAVALVCGGTGAVGSGRAGPRQAPGPPASSTPLSWVMAVMALGQPA